MNTFLFPDLVHRLHFALVYYIEACQRLTDAGYLAENTPAPQFVATQLCLHAVLFFIPHVVSKVWQVVLLTISSEVNSS